MSVPVTLVCGPCGSGKTTYVMEHMRRGDLVLDLDALGSALSGLDWYDRPECLLPFELAARNGVLGELRSGPDSGVRHAWITATAPRARQRAAITEGLNAEVVVLDVPPSTCLSRINKDERRTGDVLAWRGLVDTWWRDYEPA